MSWKIIKAFLGLAMASVLLHGYEVAAQQNLQHIQAIDPSPIRH